jgi:hypothetical protein
MHARVAQEQGAVPVNRGERLIRRMCEGREEIPDNLVDWVRQLSEIMARQPRLPKDWS